MHASCTPRQPHAGTNNTCPSSKGTVPNPSTQSPSPCPDTSPQSTCPCTYLYSRTHHDNPHTADNAHDTNANTDNTSPWHQHTPHHNNRCASLLTTCQVESLEIPFSAKI